MAVNFSHDSEFIGKRAVDMERKHDAKLSLIHVAVDLKGHLYERLLMSSLSDDVENTYRRPLSSPIHLFYSRFSHE
jgi:hypothetical protein